MGFSYQWSCRGVWLTRALNYANCFSFMLYGWDAGVISGILANQHFLGTIGNPTDTRYLTFIAAGILLGDVLGLAFIAPLSFWMGRRRLVIMCCLIGIVGALLQTTTYEPVQILVGRVVLGLANGPLSAINPIYVQEASIMHEKRTVDTMILVLWGIGGISAAAWFNFAMYKAPNPDAWRVSLAMQIFFLVVALILVLGCPDSPRWLYARGREDDGDDAMKRLIDAHEDDEVFTSAKASIMTSIALEREQTKKLTLKVLFTGDGSPTKNVHRIWVGIIVNITNPFFGTSLVGFYGQAVLKSMGLQGDDLTLAISAIFTGIPLGMVFSFWILPRVGRRPVLCWGGVILTGLMCVYTGLCSIENPSPRIQWLSVVVLILFNIVNGCSWIWLPFLYVVEILPLQYRSQVKAGSDVLFWLFGFLIVYFGGQGLGNPSIGYKVYILFCVGGAFFTALAWIFVKETKGLTLEEIDLLWADAEFKLAHQREIARIKGDAIAEKDLDLKVGAKEVA